MRDKIPGPIEFVDQLAADGLGHFTFDEAAARSGRSRTATANLLRRLGNHGLVDRVRRGYYALRPLGALGTSAAADSVLLAVAAGFAGQVHRVAYRSALDELDLTSHPSRVIQVAVAKATRSETLSGRSLTVVIESEAALGIGARKEEDTFVSDLERALLDAAARPDLVGGADTLAEAITSAAPRADPERLMFYARQLGYGAALRRIGTLADTLDLQGLTTQLTPLSPPTSDIDLEPGAGIRAWRDAKWCVRWPQPPSELAQVTHQ